MSKLYQPYKGLGLYSSRVPLLVKKLENDDYYLFSAVGNYFMAFRFSDLAAIGTSDRLKETIISMTGINNIIFCGCESVIYAFKRAKHVFKKYSYEGQKNWKIVTVLGEDGFICGVSGSNFLVIWEISSGNDVYTCQFPENVFDVCQVIQPRNYINKVLIASKQGEMHLINYVDKKTLYMFSLNKQITLLHQTPAENVIAIGCTDGSVLIHDVLYDKTFNSVKHDLGSISSIAFREDLPNKLIMLTGSETGHVSMWQMEVDKSRNIGQTRECHHGAVASLFCVSGRPMLLTNGPDNSIKVWNYDRPDGTPVLLKSRSGHWLPPSYIEYWPSGLLSTQIVSGGHDSAMNVFSTYEEKDNFSLGRAYLPKHGKREDKQTREQYVLPCPRSITCNSIRDGFWDSVVVCHEGRRQVTSWTFSKRCRGQYFLDFSLFKEKEFKYGTVAAIGCALSLCGNFVIVGYSSGHVVKYNVQSGLERGEYLAADDDASDCVVGVEVGLSGTRMVVVAAMASGAVTMWDLESRERLARLSLPAAGHLLALHPSRDMAAVATIDGNVYLIQLTTFVVFQKVRGSASGGRAITDIAFFHDAERMLVADGATLRTFDYIHQRLVDVMRVSAPVTKVRVSPNDSLVVTSHRDELGLFLWSVRSQCYDVKLSAIADDYEPAAVVELPQAVAGEADDDETVDMDVASEPMAIATKKGDCNVAATMASFTSLPASYLSGLLNVDRIRVQSEMAARGVANTASFFLPQCVETLEGVQWKDETNTVQKLFANKRKVATETDLVPLADFHRRLASAKTDDEYDECIGEMEKLTAAAADHEIEMLDPEYHAGSSVYLRTMLAMLTSLLRRARKVDLCQMYLAMVLRHHGAYFVTDGQTDDEAQMEEADPLHVHEDAPDEEREHRREAMVLVNDALGALSLSVGTHLDQDLIQVQRMAQLAGHKYI